MKGILFKPEMIKAITEGQKTQTRRVINPQPPLRFKDKKVDLIRGVIVILGESYDDCYEVHPRYDFGDTVYIKERYWQDQSGGLWGYPDTIEWPPSNCGGRAISPLFMPEWAARYYIEVDDPLISGSAVQSDTVTIDEVNLIQPQVTASTTAICENEEDGSTLNIVNASGDPVGVTYNWYYGKLNEVADSIFGNGLTTQSTIGQGVYRATKSVEGCTRYSEPITVTAYPKPETPQITTAYGAALIARDVYFYGGEEVVNA